MKQYLILTINPGSTSTKIGVFKNETAVFETTVRHSTRKLEQYQKIWEQYAFRKNEIVATLHKQGMNIADLDAVVARGGLIRPIPSGIYLIDEKMIDDARVGIQGQHASNLGCVMAYGIAWQYSLPAYIVDPPTIDDLEPLARISGLEAIKRNSLFHALNIFATARKFAADHQQDFRNLNLIVAHLGGGITVAALRKGRAINTNNGLDEGPFTPERSGSLPLLSFIELCFSGQYDKATLKKMVAGKGGLVSYFKTNSAVAIENLAKSGSKKFRLVYEAMAYQISEAIGSRATNLHGKVDAIILTGGLSYSQMLCQWIEERTSFISPVYRYPGENELQALALGGLRVLRGEEMARHYSVAPKKIGVVYWATLEKYDQAIQIIEDNFRTYGYRFRTSDSDLEIFYKNCQGKEENLRTAIDYYLEQKVDCIFSIGSMASVAAKKYLKGDIPLMCVGIYNSIVLGMLELSDNESVYASCYALDIREQMQSTIFRLSPQVATLGLLYKSGELQVEIQHDEIRRFCQQQGIELVSFDMQSTEDIPRIIELINEKQIEWLILGATTVIANASKERIATLAQAVPTLALLEKTVYRGALLGCVASWDDVCNGAAKMSLQILEGKSLPQRLCHPEQKKLLANLATAQALGQETAIRERIAEVVLV